jgi:hypothetical protein
LTDIGVQEVHDQYGFTEDVNIFNPEVNVKYGILLLHHYYTITRSITESLILYNSGYAGLRRYRMGGFNALPEETRKYIPKVLSLARRNVLMFDAIPPDGDPDDLSILVGDALTDLYGYNTGDTGALWEPVVQDLPSN